MATPYSLWTRAGQNYIASGQRPLQASFRELFRVLHKVAVNGECMKTPSAGCPLKLHRLMNWVPLFWPWKKFCCCCCFSGLGCDQNSWDCKMNGLRVREVLLYYFKFVYSVKGTEKGLWELSPIIMRAHFKAQWRHTHHPRLLHHAGNIVCPWARRSQETFLKIQFVETVGKKNKQYLKIFF